MASLQSLPRHPFPPPGPDADGRLAPLAAALLANVLLGAAIVATRYVIPRTDFLTLALLRYGLGTASLLPFLLWARPPLPPRRDLLSLAALGLLLFGLFPLTYNAALQHTLASRAGVLFALVPLLTLALAVAIGYERFQGRRLVGGLLALAGIALALGDPASLGAAPGVWRGDALMGVTVCLGAAYNVLSRRPLQRQPALTGVAISMAAGALALGVLRGLVALAGGGAGWPAFTATDWAVLAFIASGGASLGYWLFLWALKHATPTRVAVFVPLNPIVAAGLGALLLGEPAGPGLLLGLAFVTAGIVLVNWPGRTAI